MMLSALLALLAAPVAAAVLVVATRRAHTAALGLRRARDGSVETGTCRLAASNETLGRAVGRHVDR